MLLIGWVKVSLSSAFLDWFFAVLFIILLVPVFKKLKLNYFIYCAAVVFLPLTTSTIGMIRYVLVAFPVFFVIPQIIKPKILFFIICFLLLLLELRFVPTPGRCQAKL
ncbi:hypothetical protein HYW41_01400 [Candidatus Daviesbacteria bacterium]|nr:hypothetical protein [Candidatus Daviesbacteria bacterium]